MKGIAGYLVGAAVLALLGSVGLATSRVEREMASAQETLVTVDYETSVAALDTVERYYEYASHLPGVGADPLNDVRARKAALRYWQREYGALVPAGRADPVADVAPDNIPQQLIVANAVFRSGQTQPKDRAATLQMLDAGINAYLTVVTNAARQEDVLYLEDAAYNYEYLIRLRNEMGRRRRDLPPPGSDRPLGTEGQIERGKSEEQFKTYVPQEKKEREDGDAAKGAPRVRKG